MRPPACCRLFITEIHESGTLALTVKACIEDVMYAACRHAGLICEVHAHLHDWGKRCHVRLASMS